VTALFDVSLTKPIYEHKNAASDAAGEEDDDEDISLVDGTVKESGTTPIVADDDGNDGDELKEKQPHREDCIYRCLVGHVQSRAGRRRRRGRSGRHNDDMGFRVPRRQGLHDYFVVFLSTA